MKNKYLDAKIIAERIINRYLGIRESEAYKEAQENIIEQTMSCNKKEQKAWMKKYMIEALHEEKEAKINTSIKSTRANAIYNAAVKFIAAYDLI